MERIGLLKIIDETLGPIGFMKKKNDWVLEVGDLIKLVNLQKSRHGNFFYINYGYTLNKVPLGDLTMHISNRVNSSDLKERNRIDELLDLDKEIPDEHRHKGLMQLLQDTLVRKLSSINSEQDLLAELKNQSHFNNVPLGVKNYFGL